MIQHIIKKVFFLSKKSAKKCARMNAISNTIQMKSLQEIALINIGYRIWILHGEYPDIFVQHIPAMDVIGFLCNFSGLLGMWLGLSLSGIFHDIFNLITKISYRKYINLFIVKVNQVNNYFLNLPNRQIIRLLNHRRIV